jgi:beta-glucosidase
MKRVFPIFLVLLMICFTACSTNLDPNPSSTPSPSPSSNPNPVPIYISAPYTLAEGETIDSKILDPVFYENENGPTIGVTMLGVIEYDGMYFRDLNNNHELDVFEDWRNDASTRAAAMAASLSNSQLAYNLLNIMMYSPKKTAVADVVDENGKPVWANLFSNTIEDLNTQRYRNFVVRNNPATEVAVWFNNGLEQYAEWDAIQRNETAVPFLSFTNPISHGLPSSEGVAAACLGDGNADLVLRDAQYDGDIMWAKGIDGIYGPQIDLATDPRWSRNGTTYGEVVWMAEQIAESLVIGYQNGDDGMVKGSILLTIKHFPGDGAAYNGFESHGNTGRYRIYQTENSLALYQLRPFIAAIEAGAAGVMPGYSQPVNDGRSAPQSITYNGETYDLLFDGYGNAFNEDILQTLLRNILGFDGLINSDSVSNSNAHGVNEYGDNLTPLQQTVLYVKAGCDAGVFAAGGAMGGMTIHPELIEQALNEGLLTRADLERAAYYRLKPRAESGDLDNPYRDMEESLAIVNGLTPKVAELAEEANLKSVVLLKNLEHTLPLVDKTQKIYVGGYNQKGNANVSGFKTKLTDLGYNVVQDYNEADVAYLRVSPTLVGQGSNQLAILDLGQDMVTPVYDEMAKPTGQTATITTVLNMANFQQIANAIHAKGGKVIGEIVANSPWILTEMEPYCDALIATFSTSDSAIATVVSGGYAPTGRLPMTMVADASVIALVPTEINGEIWEVCVSPNDVPGYDKPRYMDPAVLAASPSGTYAYKDAASQFYWSGFGLTY